jgi:hypothetical protein
MPESAPKFWALLKKLEDHHVEYIIVGGVCAVLHGAPLNTMDIDIVHLRTPENLERLTQALQELQAYYREHPPHKILPEAQTLGTSGHHLLMTSAGPMDVLGTIVGNRGYEQLLPNTIIVTLSEGLQVRILDLPTLIQVKLETGRQKDRMVLPILRRTLEESERTDKT